MKKILCSILILCCITFTVPFVDASTEEEIPITIFVDGKQIETDTDPIIENGRTLVPIRFVSEALGAKVGWYEYSSVVRVLKDDTAIRFKIGSNYITINDNNLIELDVPAKIVNNRTLVPLRVISETFGANVEWVESERKVVITSASENQSNASNFKPSGLSTLSNDDFTHIATPESDIDNYVGTICSFTGFISSVPDGDIYITPFDSPFREGFLVVVKIEPNDEYSDVFKTGNVVTVEGKISSISRKNYSSYIHLTDVSYVSDIVELTGSIRIRKTEEGISEMQVYNLLHQDDTLNTPGENCPIPGSTTNYFFWYPVELPDDHPAEDFIPKATLNGKPIFKYDFITVKVNAKWEGAVFSPSNANSASNRLIIEELIDFKTY